MSVPYVDYTKMKEFYTIQEVCNLLQMSKSELKAQCEHHDIAPRRNEIGEFGLVKYEVCKIHNPLYFAGRDKKRPQRGDDPWA